MRLSRPLGVLALCLLLLQLLAWAPSAQNTPGVSVNLVGPERVEAGGQASYSVKIYGPSDIKWGFTLNVSGKYRTQATLTSSAGKQGTDSAQMVHDLPLAVPEFNFTLNAPTKAGSLTLSLDVLAVEGAGAAGQRASTRWSVSVRPKREVTINATVSNSGGTPVENLKVTFQVWLNGQWTLIANESIPTIEPGGKQNVSTKWNSTLLDSGEYRVRVLIDPDSEKVLFSGGSRTIERTVALREPGTSLPKPIAPGLVVLVVLAIAVPAALIFWYRKKKIV